MGKHNDSIYGYYQAQQLMFVKYQEDTTKELRKNKVTESGFEEEWKIQFGWDKHATFLKPNQGR